MAETFAQYNKNAAAFGSSLEGRDEWLVFLTQTRDSDHLTESNFAAALKTLGGESETVEIVRFGHWAVGWVEHLFVHPSRKAEVAAIEAQLEDYPALDEDDWSQRESDAAFESWVQFGCDEFAEALQNEFDLMDSTRDLLTRSPYWTLCVFENHAPYVLCTEGDTVTLQAYGGQTRLTRETLAGSLRALRRELQKHA